MKVNAITCQKCGDTIYSRATHDMRYCTCKSCVIDGGFEYIRVIGCDYLLRKVDVKATKTQLYNDWNKRNDKFGLIKGKKHAVKHAG